MDDEKEKNDDVKEKTKKGKVDKLTKDVADFKEGIQKTKSYVTCEDVLKKMRSEGKEI